MTPKQILDGVRAALEHAAASKGASATVRVYSRAALAKLDRLEMVEGGAYRLEDPEGYCGFTSVKLDCDTPALLLTLKGDT